MSDTSSFFSFMYVMDCDLESLKIKQILVTWGTKAPEGMTGCAPVFDGETNSNLTRLMCLAAKKNSKMCVDSIPKD